ncbi:hypothetical protein L798_01416 [Zootermopsis nevadensis]|uniref:Uncharacterized protein n=1 Tax=Zootermopsis nevadensis TaxID=136037 RepID=A0A067RF73_ZOONE|nr:hypothetical protein L798_01416 [Zootermopsis nevadensis]
MVYLLGLKVNLAYGLWMNKAAHRKIKTIVANRACSRTREHDIRGVHYSRSTCLGLRSHFDQRWWSFFLMNVFPLVFYKSEQKFLYVGGNFHTPCKIKPLAV